MTNDNILRIDTSIGELCVYVDKENKPSAGIYFVPKGSDGEIIDLAYVDITGEDINIYTYTDPYTEDYTTKNTIRHDDVIKSCGI